MIVIFFEYLVIVFLNCSFLNERKGMSWPTARFFADRIEGYLCDVPHNKRPKKAFNFERTKIDQHIAQNCMRFIFLDGTLSISVLQAVYYFAEYLKENRVFSDEDINNTGQACLSLFETSKKALPASDAGPRIFSTFPNYQWAV